MTVDRQRYALGIVTLAVRAAALPGPGERFEVPTARARRLLAVDGPAYGLGPDDRDLVMSVANSLVRNPPDLRRLTEIFE